MRGSGVTFQCAPHPPNVRLVDIHAVENVTAERVDLVVFDLFPDRLINDGVSHRQPGRLFLEDDLSLLINLVRCATSGVRLALISNSLNGW